MQIVQEQQVSSFSTMLNMLMCLFSKRTGHKGYFSWHGQNINNQKSHETKPWIKFGPEEKLHLVVVEY